MSAKSLNSLKIKIYCDGADRESMIQNNQIPYIQGFTTNPTLMKKAGIKNYKSFCLDILKTISVKPISFEIFADEFPEMERQAQEIAPWGKNVYVKIPITNSKGESSIPLIHKLSHAGVKLNVTAVLTSDQIRISCEALKGGAPSILSVFAGRIADTGEDPMPLMKNAYQLCHSTDPKIELLWASTREPLNIIQANDLGCHIITVPFDILDKAKKLFGYDLKQLSLETVQMFKSDAEKAGFSL